MELKVWVEGIQRIVCGVNEKTTCQDVVYALAHATGKTGRFTLIERWRNSERLLAPNELPLKVLLKWGEHSSDVQFILHWAPLDSGAKGGPAKNLSEPHSAFTKNSPNVTSPNGTSSKQKFTGNLPSPSEGGGSMKRSKDSVPSDGVMRGVSHRNNESLTNSGPSAMDNSSTGSNGKVSSANNSVNGGNNNKIWSGEGSDYSFDSDTCSPGKNLKDLTSPPPYRDPPNPKGLSHSPVTSAGVSHKGLPPYREPPPPNLLSHQQQVQMQQQHRLNSGSGSPVVNQQQQQQATHLINNSSGSSSNQSGSPVINHIGGNHNNNVSMFDSNVSTQSPRTNESYNNSLNYSSDKPSDDVESWKNKDHSITNGDISASSQNGSMPKPTSSSSNSQYQELVRLINLQREKLTEQHAEMTKYDAEIMFWEAKMKQQQRHLEFITKEISRLELVSAQQESQVLSLLHLEEENELVKHQSGQLKTEIDALRTEFANCEQELTLCKNKMGALTSELHMQHVAIKQKQEDWMQREANTLAEIDRLKRELDIARRETDVVTDLSGTLDEEVSSIEADLAGKRKQMEILINQMKQANLQSLAIQPPDESIDGGTFNHRSGSTRRMIGSLPLPATQTSKHPHGVWV